jgi:uncharacterized protein (DUF885 family)
VPNHTEDHAQKARDLADRYWEGLLELDPFIGTQVGDERYDDRLPDPSEEGLAAKKTFHEGALRDLAEIDRDALDADLRATMEVIDFGSHREIEEVDLRVDRLWASSHLFGPGQLLAILASLQRADTPERADRYARRLEAMPAFLDAIDEVVRDGARTGQTQPGLVVDRSIGQMERLLEMAPEASPGMAPVASSSPEIQERVAAVLRDQVWPAFGRYLEALRASRPSARGGIGLSALSNGAELYASRIYAYTTLHVDAQHVHDVGQEQLAMIQQERQRIAEALGYPDAAKAIEAYTDSGRNRASTREEMVQLAERQVASSWDAAPAYFGRLPKDNCEVKPVEEFRERDTPAAFYFPPSSDGSRRGIYFINTSDLDKRPLHQVATTTYHEANPGHHFQLSIEQEFADRPAVRRFGANLGGTSFIEGWGLYSERLADEMGLFADEYERLGMLEAQGWRACRLIVDSGIHALGWDRDRSIDIMVEAGVPHVSAEIETDRYIAWPGQALAYMMGQLHIQRLRGELAARDGASFSLKDFHDGLLSLGSLPLDAIEREMKR